MEFSNELLYEKTCENIKEKLEKYIENFSKEILFNLKLGK